MKRRQLLATAGAGLALPRIARAQGARSEGARSLRFIPQADLSALDPHWTTAYVTRNHGFMVFDTLYGQDGAFEASAADGRRATSRGRRQAVDADPARRPAVARRHAGAGARLRRQHPPLGRADAFGQALLAATDELSAPDDRPSCSA